LGGTVVNTEIFPAVLSKARPSSNLLAMVFLFIDKDLTGFHKTFINQCDFDLPNPNRLAIR